MSFKIDKKNLIFTFLFSFLIFPKLALAHTFGQPPFFSVNGKLANLYPVPVTSLTDFALSQDAPPESYYVNQRILFELLESKLPAPPEIIRKTKFNWEFGDGDKSSGLGADHTYIRMGSYLLKIYADDGTTPTPQLLESILINVLPDKNYKLPSSVITINGKQSKDPLTDILSEKFGEPLTLNGSISKEGTAKIVSYFWDFGDQKSGTGPKVIHVYSPDLSQLFPVLRVTDSNGFYADSFVEIQNQDLGAPIKQTSTRSAAPAIQNFQNSRNQRSLYVALELIFGVGIVALIIRYLRKKRAQS